MPCLWVLRDQGPDVFRSWQEKESMNLGQGETCPSSTNLSRISMGWCRVREPDPGAVRGASVGLARTLLIACNSFLPQVDQHCPGGLVIGSNSEVVGFMTGRQNLGIN